MASRTGQPSFPFSSVKNNEGICCCLVFVMLVMSTLETRNYSLLSFKLSGSATEVPHGVLNSTMHHMLSVVCLFFNTEFERPVSALSREA